MWNPDAVSIPNAFSPQVYSLPDDILAMEIVPSATGEARLGPISKIPEGADIECGGQGFNERTVKVLWRGHVLLRFSTRSRNSTPTGGKLRVLLSFARQNRHIHQPLHKAHAL
ncbi:MAG TPA: hypothetical protein VMF91_19560 [Bryobacteraceae bacterium]|nr:hypothetical protein [Bryobacteraceae bacterium]